MDDNTKIMVKADVNKSLTQIGNGLGATPIIGDTFLEQAHHKDMCEHQKKQDKIAITDGLAYYDYTKKQIVYFKDIDDPKRKIEACREARIGLVREKILDYVLEELENKKINLEDMVIGVDTDYLNEEFLPYWDKYSDDMNRDNLQNLWAKILVQEMQNPHTVSMRTMRFVKTLSKRDAHIFNMILPYVIGNDTIPYIYNVINPIDLQHLEHRGFLLGNRVVVLEKENVFPIGKQALKSDEFHFSCYALSDIGKELYLIADVEDCDFDKLEEAFDHDTYVKIGSKISFHNMVNKIQYNPTPFRDYQRTENKKDIHIKYKDLPRLSLEPNI